MPANFDITTTGNCGKLIFHKEFVECTGSLFTYYYLLAKISAPISLGNGTYQFDAIPVTNDTILTYSWNLNGAPFKTTSSAVYPKDNGIQTTH